MHGRRQSTTQPTADRHAHPSSGTKNERKRRAHLARSRCGCRLPRCLMHKCCTPATGRREAVEAGGRLNWYVFEPTRLEEGSISDACVRACFCVCMCAVCMSVRCMCVCERILEFSRPSGRATRAHRLEACSLCCSMSRCCTAGLLDTACMARPKASLNQRSQAHIACCSRCPCRFRCHILQHTLGGGKQAGGRMTRGASQQKSNRLI
jgi:hypothetical protein